MDYEQYREFLAAEAGRQWGEDRAAALGETIDRVARTLATIEATPLTGEEPFFTDIFNLSAAKPDNAG